MASKRAHHGGELSDVGGGVDGASGGQVAEAQGPTQAASARRVSVRLDYLDWLRLLMVMAVVYAHTAVSGLRGGGGFHLGAGLASASRGLVNQWGRLSPARCFGQMCRRSEDAPRGRIHRFNVASRPAQTNRLSSLSGASPGRVGISRRRCAWTSLPTSEGHLQVMVAAR